MKHEIPNVPDSINVQVPNIIGRFSKKIETNEYNFEDKVVDLSISLKTDTCFCIVKFKPVSSMKFHEYKVELNGIKKEKVNRNYKYDLLANCYPKK